MYLLCGAGYVQHRGNQKGRFVTCDKPPPRNLVIVIVAVGEAAIFEVRLRVLLELRTCVHAFRPIPYKSETRKVKSIILGLRFDIEVFLYFCLSYIFTR